MTSFSLYPNDIDGYSTLPLRKDLVHEIRADDYNRLRDAIVKLEQELGIQPSGTFATVRSRLDFIGDSSALIQAHLIDPIDAHDASAISIVDVGDNYVSTEVEGALGELASVLPTPPDVIGIDNDAVPNDGIPDFVAKAGTLHVFNTSAGITILDKTQPVNITGIHIIEVGEANGSGTAAELSFSAPGNLQWQAPGDSFGAAVDVSSLSVGEVVTVSSADTSKKIRVARTSATLPVGSVNDTFDILRLDAKTGTFSLPGTGFITTNYATRLAASATGATRNQFMIKGVIYPADRGTLVLQRKLRLGSDVFTPVAVLDLSTNFDENFRADGQPVYTPALSGFDTITLFDRYPIRNDYDQLEPGADGYIYDNFSVSTTFIPFQIAKYLIPVSNDSGGVNGTLESPSNFTAAEVENKVSAYRIVHYKTGITDFVGEPSADDIFSLSDPLGSSSDGDNDVRFSNLYSDSNTTRPNIDTAILRPVSDTSVSGSRRSGIDYYHLDSFKFDIEIKGSNVFRNIYTSEGTLTFTNASNFSFPSGVEDDAYGTTVNIGELFDDGYTKFSTSNLPTISDSAFYLINATNNTARRPAVADNAYSNNAFVTINLHDPFGFNKQDAYGFSTDTSQQVRLLVNSDTGTSTNSVENFKHEFYRVDAAENFTFALDEGQFSGAGSNGIITAFDSTTILGATDLQVGGLFSAINTPGLVYPQENYDSSDIRPTQQAGTDYSAFTGTRIYQRVFSIGYTTNGGRLRVVSGGDNPLEYNDIDASNNSRPVKIEVKVPGSSSNSTGFLDLGSLFATARVEDGYGAVSGPIIGTTGDFTVPFTFGIVNTADTGYNIAVRVTFNPANTGPVLADAKTRLLTRLELLAP